MSQWLFQVGEARSVEWFLPSGIIDRVCPGHPGVDSILDEDYQTSATDQQQTVLVRKHTPGCLFHKVLVVCQTCQQEIQRHEIGLFKQQMKDKHCFYCNQQN
jgi:hypothetical protein